jgi:hypothetical protein
MLQLLLWCARARFADVLTPFIVLAHAGQQADLANPSSVLAESESLALPSVAL